MIYHEYPRAVLLPLYGRAPKADMHVCCRNNKKNVKKLELGLKLVCGSMQLSRN